MCQKPKDKHNRLTSGELLSNDQRAVDFRSIQLHIRYASIRWGGGGGVSGVGGQAMGVGLGGLDERGVQITKGTRVDRGDMRFVETHI